MINSKREIINYPNNMPFKCTFTKLHNKRRHSHDDISVIFVVDGFVNIIINDKNYELKTDSVVLINSNDVHEIYYVSDNAKAIILYFNPKITLTNPNSYFLCNSAIENNEKYNKIRSFLVKLLKLTISRANDYEYISIFFEFISYIHSYFITNQKNQRKFQKHEKRITSIINYIEENYKNRVSLQELADHENLSVSYLSIFFEKWFGKSFLTYYNDVRIDYAVDDLIQTNLSIEEIAIQNGFDDPRSFVSAFKKRYHTLPSLYRKEMKKPHETPSFETNTALKEASQVYEKLNAYYNDNLNNEPLLADKNIKADSFLEVKNIDYLKEGTTLNNNFNKFIGVVSAHDILLGDVQNLLTRVRKELNYEYIKFHSLLSDEMEVYNEDEDGNPIYNYFYTDKVLDFILSIGLKPVIQLSFMPKKLALYPDRTVFNGKYLNSRPNDMNKWNDLIENFIEHLLIKYGKEETETWLYTIWNKPDTGEFLFGFESKSLFYDFFENTYNSIKKVLPNAKIGTPTLNSQYNTHFEFMNYFLNKCKENNINLDFINLSYSNDIFEKTTDKYAISQRSKLYNDENHYEKTLDSTLNEIKKLGYDNIPIYLTTWLFTASHRNLLSDTCFKSCYYIKNYLENLNKLDGYGYWCLTDLNSESMITSSLFHGGLGLFTRNGIEKSIYNAFLLLQKLDSNILYNGKGYIITKSHKKMHVLLYNYVNYSEFYSEGNLLLTQIERYTPFNMKKKKLFTLEFENIDSSKVLIKDYIVSREHGSSFDAFIRMGGIELKYDDEFAHLKRHSSYYMEIKEKNIENNKLILQKELNPLEIRLIEIKLL